MILNKIRLSLRTAIFIVFFIFSLIMILSVMYIQFYRENETLNVMSERIIDTRGEAVSNALNYYIHIPQQANSIAAIFIKTLDTDNWDLTFQQIEGYLYKVMTQTFSLAQSPLVAFKGITLDLDAILRRTGRSKLKRIMRLTINCCSIKMEPARVQCSIALMIIIFLADLGLVLSMPLDVLCGAMHTEMLIQNQG